MMAGPIARPLSLADEEPAPFRFNRHELAGSLGDLGTFLPLATALAIQCGMQLALIFIFAGLMHILSGWLFRQPMPVQPMKAIAAVAITQQLMPGEIAAAGILMGVLMIMLAAFGAVDALVRYVPQSVVRGIQAGVGLKLVFDAVGSLTGMDLIHAQWSAALPLWGWDSLLMAGLALGLIVCPPFKRWPVLLIVFTGGLVVAGIVQTPSAQGIRFGALNIQLAMPNAAAWWNGFWQGALPQLPLTLLNSVVAVCALSADLYPGRGIKPRRVATSVGLMNLLAVPFGGMPMCHGSGGLAAQHRFGARTGGSVIMLGAIKIVAGLVFGAALVPVVQAYPRSILAVMLLVAGLALARPARDSLQGAALIVVIVTVGGILLGNTLVGTAVGFGVYLLWHYLLKCAKASGRFDA
jgi:MFS superfamily sulfate permease-like transporter